MIVDSKRTASMFGVHAFFHDNIVNVDARNGIGRTVGSIDLHLERVIHEHS